MQTATIIGSGPNGLSAAIVLAAAGVATTVFERNIQIGGANHEWLWKRCDEGIQQPWAKFDRRAYEFGAFPHWAVKAMEPRTWKKQDARRTNDHLTGIWPGDLQSSLLEHMKMTGMFAFLIPGASAQESRIKHPSRERKSFEEGRESIHFETIRYRNDTLRRQYASSHP